MTELITQPMVGELMTLAGVRFANDYHRRFGLCTIFRHILLESQLHKLRTARQKRS